MDYDKQLRQLIFKTIQDIEISLRTKMIQVFSMEHGAFWFMDASLFKNADFYEGCLDNIKKEIVGRLSQHGFTCYGISARMGKRIFMEVATNVRI